MAKFKTAKKGTRVDMTAMCDVAFLLLTFFVMTSTARLPEPYPVDTPSSTVQTKLPDSNIGTITVGEDENKIGRVFFGIAGQEERKLMLQRMAEKYQLTFSPEQINAFALIDGFGVDIRQLDKLIAMNGTDRNTPGVQPGIPYDSLNNQLSDWIRCAREATREYAKTLPGLSREELAQRADLNIAIKGDAETQYPLIQKVIAILQDQGKNNFFLVTGLRGDDF